MSEFDGFPQEGLDLLAQLPAHDKAWFAEHKEEYDALVAAPAKAFATAVGQALRSSISEHLVVSPKVNGAISPINNDVRFNPEGPTYKDHVLFRWWEGPTRRTAPTLFVRLSGDDIGLATGAAFATTDRWRQAVADDGTGPELIEGIARLRKGRKLDVVGEGLKRVPAPYPADHPRADLLRHTSFQARWLRPVPRSVTSASFAPWCAQQLGATADIHRWLVAHTL